MVCLCNLNDAALDLRVFGVKGVTDFSRGFTDAFEAAFYGVLGLRFGCELLRGETLDV